MNRKLYFITTAMIIAVLSGCTGNTSKDDQTIISSENSSRIAGMQWILQKMTIDGTEYPLTGEMPFVKFEIDGKVNGFASVNRFFGSMQIDQQGQVIWSKAFGSTRMAGPEKLMNQENAFLKALPMTSQLAIKGIHLHAYTKDRQTECIFHVPVN